MKLFQRKPPPRLIPDISEFNTIEEYRAWVERVFDAHTDEVVRKVVMSCARDRLWSDIKLLCRHALRSVRFW